MSIIGFVVNHADETSGKEFLTRFSEVELVDSDAEIVKISDWRVQEGGSL